MGKRGSWSLPEFGVALPPLGLGIFWSVSFLPKIRPIFFFKSPKSSSRSGGPSSWSIFQSLGWNNPRFNAWRWTFATGFALVVVIGNISFPIAVLAGIVKI